MTTFLFLVLLASSPVRFECLTVLPLPIPALHSNGLSLPFLGIQDNRLFYLTDKEVHVIGGFPKDNYSRNLELIKKFSVFTAEENLSGKRPLWPVGMLVSLNRVFVLLWANGFENEEGFEINHYLRTYDFEGNLIYSKEFPMKSEVEKGIDKWSYPRSFHFNESGLLEVDCPITNLNKTPTWEEIQFGGNYELETWCFDKKDGRLLTHLQRPIPQPPSLLGGNGLICQTGQDTMSIGSFYDMSVCKMGSTSGSLKVLIRQMDESFPALLSVPQSDEKRELFVFKVMSNKGEKIGSLTLQPGSSPVITNATFFTLPGGGFGFVDHFYNGSILKLGFLITRKD